MSQALPKTTPWVWKSRMGNCQNYGPFLGPFYNTGPNTGPNLGDPKRDHNFDSSPHEKLESLAFGRREGWAAVDFFTANASSSL